MARGRAVLVLLVILAAAALALSGGTSSDPRTPAALPGMPPPFLTAAVLGDGRLTAGVDAYGTIADLRSGPAGTAQIENPRERQAAGTVETGTGIVPRVWAGGRWKPLWRADEVRQTYLPGTNVLRTVARFGGERVAIECAATTALACRATGGDVRFPRDTGQADCASGIRLTVDARASPAFACGRGGSLLREAAAGDRAWLRGARPLEPDAPAWAKRLYERSLLVLRAALDRHSGAVAAGARDGWAYVWPRDAGAVAIALAGSGYRAEARLAAGFLLGIDLEAAARFTGTGEPVPGREAQGDAAGWALAAAGAAGAHLTERDLDRLRAYEWRDRADYQEVSAGDYLGNALAAGGSHQVDQASPGELDEIWEDGLDREVGDPGSGLDSAAAWAVRPFPDLSLFPAARRAMLTLAREGGRFGIVPSQSWPHEDPWSAPTAWSAWSLAALSRSPRGTLRDRAAALGLLADLRRAATPAGLLPERLDRQTGVPTSTTPLAWSHAFAILALNELWPPRLSSAR